MSHYSDVKLKILLQVVYYLDKLNILILEYNLDSNTFFYLDTLLIKNSFRHFIKCLGNIYNKCQN